MESKVVIIDSPDVICKKCLNSDGIKCVKYPRLDDVDYEAISKFGLKYGEYTAREIITRLAPKKFAKLAYSKRLE